MIVVANGTPREPAPQVILQAPVLAPDMMAERIARFDWGRTSLGPLPRWPASLRIAVDMMHLSPFPCAVVWGPDLSVVHNDAYRALRPVAPMHWARLRCAVERCMAGDGALGIQGA